MNLQARENYISGTGEEIGFHILNLEHRTAPSYKKKVSLSKVKDLPQYSLEHVCTESLEEGFCTLTNVEVKFLTTSQRQKPMAIISQDNFEGNLYLWGGCPPLSEGVSYTLKGVKISKKFNGDGSLMALTPESQIEELNLSQVHEVQDDNHNDAEDGSINEEDEFARSNCAEDDESDMVDLTRFGKRSAMEDGDDPEEVQARLDFRERKKRASAATGLSLRSKGK